MLKSPKNLQNRHNIGDLYKVKKEILPSLKEDKWNYTILLLTGINIEYLEFKCFFYDNKLADVWWSEEEVYKLC